MLKRLIKAFIAGMAFPAAFLSIIYTIAYLWGFSPVLEYPLQFIPMWLPWIFGLWNMLYVYRKRPIPIKDKQERYWFLGASLGFLLAVFGIVVIKLPVILFGFKGVQQIIPLFVVPLVYGIIWRYVVMHLNDLVGIKK